MSLQAIDYAIIVVIVDQSSNRDWYTIWCWTATMKSQINLVSQIELSKSHKSKLSTVKTSSMKHQEKITDKLCKTLEMYQLLSDHYIKQNILIPMMMMKTTSLSLFLFAANYDWLISCCYNAHCCLMCLSLSDPWSDTIGWPAETTSSSGWVHYNLTQELYQGLSTKLLSCSVFLYLPPIH